MCSIGKLVSLANTVLQVFRGIEESEFVQNSLRIICTKHFVPYDTGNFGKCLYKMKHLSVPQRLLRLLPAFYLNSLWFYIFQNTLYVKQPSFNSCVSKCRFLCLQMCFKMSKHISKHTQWPLYKVYRYNLLQFHITALPKILPLKGV